MVDVTGQPQMADMTGQASGFDPAAMQEVTSRMMADISAAMATLMCALGLRLGIFAHMAALGPVTSEELAAASGLDQRYLTEWLHALAAAGYLEAAQDTKQFAMSPDLALLVAEGSPVNVSGGYQLIPALASAVGEVAEAFRSGDGIPPDRYSPELFEAMDLMSATWLDSMYARVWIPAITGLAERLHAGGRVADIGCGGGRALVLGAQAFPASQFTGYEAYRPSVERAREAAAAAGVSGRVEVVHGDALTLLEGHYDLVTAFNTVHDTADPAALLGRIRKSVDPDGVLLLLESAAADDPLHNSGSAAAILYATSVLYCLPSSRTGDGQGLGTLGLPAGAIRDLCGTAGFRSIRLIPSPDPFNAVYEIRP